jgi:hypothetical protein
MRIQADMDPQHLKPLYPIQTRKGQWTQIKGRKNSPQARQKTVWRIRDVNPGSDFFPSRIPDPNCLHPGSRILIKEFKYFNPPKKQKMVSKL